MILTYVGFSSFWGFPAAVPKAIEQGDCPDNCTPQEKVALAQALQIFQRDYAEEFEKLKVHYKATPEQLKQLQEWIDAQLATTKTA